MLKDRADLKNIPVFLVTAEDAAPKEIMGFKMGAQDYIHKPLDPSRLRARIEARLKPVDPALNRVTRGDLELDLESMRLFRNDQGILHEIPVTPIEFKLLLYMLKRGDSIFTRDQLLEAGWNDLTEVFDRTVDAHLSKLRKKLADTEVRIEPVRGVGYRIVQLTVKE
ncbi:MAG: response regulator transcription factor, partial [Proteobacteria bacterium]